jgi:hypothetical protein
MAEVGKCDKKVSEIETAAEMHIQRNASRMKRLASLKNTNEPPSPLRKYNQKRTRKSSD